MPKSKPLARQQKDDRREWIITLCWRDMRNLGWPLPLCAAIETQRIDRANARLLGEKEGE